MAVVICNDADDRGIAALSFVFSIAPKRAVHHSTGYNDHYQYLNKGTETLFNGVGMGGQTEYGMMMVVMVMVARDCAISGYSAVVIMILAYH